MNIRDNSWKHHKIGIIIAVINAVLVLNAAWFFLVVANFPVPGWLVFNICTPSVLLFLTGFISKRTGIMSVSIPFLLFFGGGGLFLFGWAESMVFAQMCHLSMILACAYTIYVIISEKRWKNLSIGVIIGAVVLAGLFPFQQRYVTSHPEMIKKMGDPTFEEFIKSKSAER